MELELYNTRLKYEDGVLWRWFRDKRWKEVKITPQGKKGYSKIGLGYKMYFYHRVVYKVCNPEWDITDNSRENEIDHICGVKPLDNRIENLRVTNHNKNMYNNLHLNHKGYSQSSSSNKYFTRIRVDGKQKHLGSYDTPEQAREAYLKAKLTYHQM